MLKTTTLAVTISTTLLMGCQKEVDKERMDAAGAWAKTVCECARAPGADRAQCMEKHPEPPDPGSESGVGSQPKYKLESLKAYDAIKAVGTKCLLGQE